MIQNWSRMDLNLSRMDWNRLELIQNGLELIVIDPELTGIDPSNSSCLLSRSDNKTSWKFDNESKSSITIHSIWFTTIQSNISIYGLHGESSEFSPSSNWLGSCQSRSFSSTIDCHWVNHFSCLHIIYWFVLVVSFSLCVFQFQNLNLSIPPHKSPYLRFVMEIVRIFDILPEISTKDRWMYLQIIPNGLCSIEWIHIKIFGFSVAIPA